MKLRLRLFFFLSLFALSCASSQAQVTSRTAYRMRSGAALPSTCSALNGDVFVKNSVSPTELYLCTTPNTWTKFGTGSGTVTSVGLSLPSIFTVSGSPVTTSGTLTGTLATQTANTLFAGPTTGAAAAPTFRGVVLADIPTGALGTGTPDGTKFLRDDRTFVTPTAGVTGSGTTPTIPKWTASTALGNSLLTDDGTNVSLSSGKFLFPSGSTPSLAPTGSTTSGFGADGTHLYGFIGGASIFQVVSTGAFINSNTLTHGFFLGSSGDVALSRDAADILAQRRSTNAQAFRLYNTFSDASNYERYGVRWSSNVLILGTENAGTGTARGMQLTPATNLLEQVNGTSAQALRVYRTNANSGEFFHVDASTDPITVSAKRGSGSATQRTIQIGVETETGTFKGWQIDTSGNLVPVAAGGVGTSTSPVPSQSFFNSYIRFTTDATSVIHKSGKSDPENGIEVGFIGFDTTAYGYTQADQSGSNSGGKSFTLSAGRGTGTGIPSYVRLRSGAMGTASGSTLHTNVDRQFMGATKTGLTAGSANTIIQVTLAAGSMSGGNIRYTVEATDGTDFQACSGMVHWSGVNKAGTFTTNITATPTETCSASSGTLADTWTITTAAGVMNLRVTPTITVITATTVRVTYAIENFGESDIAIQ